MNNILLCGNPNVGKSSIYNKLTSSHEHTGNWTGKTVDIAKSKIKNTVYNLIDLPGIYSLSSLSDEEIIARDILINTNYKKIIYVMDSSNIERNMNLLLQILEINKNVILCLNMIDEIDKKGIEIDVDLLSDILGIDIVCTSVNKNIGFDKLISLLDNSRISNFNYLYNYDSENRINKLSNEISSRVVKRNKNKKVSLFDKLLTNKISSVILMLMMLFVIFFITLVLANYPSNLLSALFNKIELLLNIKSSLITCIYRVVTFIISVMFPPLVIFFFLFSCLEESGLLPRIAFNLDIVCNKCNCHGKQVLSICSGFGCNACAVVGTRIIDSKRDRLLAILTNSFIPCNGRFPFLITIISIFMSDNYLIAATYLVLFISFSIFLSFIVTYLLSKTILKGYPGFFVLELPDYRRINIKKVFVNSFIYKSLSILKKTIVVSILAGIIIWTLNNIFINDISLYIRLIHFIDPLSRLLGLDGVILSSFILGLPANEIVMPLIMMGYMNSNNIIDISDINVIKNILLVNGWNIKTAICSILFCLIHYPCGTTLLTIKSEVGFKWMVFSIIIPLLTIAILLVIINIVML